MFAVSFVAISIMNLKTRNFSKQMKMINGIVFLINTPPESHGVRSSYHPYYNGRHGIYFHVLIALLLRKWPPDYVGH